MPSLVEKKWGGDVITVLVLVSLMFSTKACLYKSTYMSVNMCMHAYCIHVNNHVMLCCMAGRMQDPNAGKLTESSSFIAEVTIISIKQN